VSDSTSGSASHPLAALGAEVRGGRSGVSRLPPDARLPRVGTSRGRTWRFVVVVRGEFAMALDTPPHRTSTQIRPGALQIATRGSEMGVVRCRGGHRSGRRSLRSRHRDVDWPPAGMAGGAQLSRPARPRDRTPLQARVENDTPPYSSGPHGCGQAPITLPNAVVLVARTKDCSFPSDRSAIAEATSCRSSVCPGAARGGLDHTHGGVLPK